MTQILVTLESGADPNLIQRIIDNIKGVFHTSVETASTNDLSLTKHDVWMGQVKELTSSFDPNLIDLNDERTQYLMNK